MGSEHQQLHVAFFPFMAHGHMIPTFDLAKLFAGRDVKTTIITTPMNAHAFAKTNVPMNLEIFTFPAQEAGLPENCENLEQAMSIGLLPAFIKASAMLCDQLERFLERSQPNCLVADMFFPWATESARKFNVPRIVFHGTGFLSLCAKEVERLYRPFKNVSSDDEVVVLPRLPHEVKLTRTQVSEEEWSDDDNEFNKRSARIKESEVESYGVIVNSFYELEPEFADFFRNELGRRAWNVGPVSLCNRKTEDKARRGKQANVNEQECLIWLDSKKRASVVYVCFGSTAHYAPAQLHEIANALEASGHNFVWAVGNVDKGSDGEELLPQGFEQRTEGRGLIIRGWAPQVLILEHEAVGAFMTHCGWNSTLEGISAGVPMVTWPVFAEQFYNEKLVTQILKIGVEVGAKKWSRTAMIEHKISGDAIEKALKEIMEGEKAEEMRNKARQLKEMAWKAVEEGGSSYNDLTALISELRNYKA
uniref:Glycosyltransferase n=1 Tax=Dianthus caryophyllus TaxID=3570 RepID=A0A5S9MRF7_DIACA|nr:chalcononaringenin 2'-O-glucosyltransferase [Dianthus caryophyllus]